MQVVCKVNCPYNDRGFCSRGLTAIDENGMCSLWWRKGQQYRNFGELGQNSLYKEEIIIVDGKEIDNGILSSGTDEQESGQNSDSSGKS